jgi:hypothetical protein
MRRVSLLGLLVVVCVGLLVALRWVNEVEATESKLDFRATVLEHRVEKLEQRMYARTDASNMTREVGDFPPWYGGQGTDGGVPASTRP